MKMEYPLTIEPIMPLQCGYGFLLLKEGNADAQTMLGIIYEEGQGVSQLPFVIYSAAGAVRLTHRPASCAGASRLRRRSHCLAHATRRLRAFDDVDLNGRRLIHAQHLISIEVGLLDTAVLQRDLAIEGGGGAEDNSALDLRLHRVGVDDGAAIHRTDHTANANSALVRHFDLGNVRLVAAEDELQRDAAAASFGQGLSPASFFRGKIEDRFGARRLVEQRPAISDRVLFRGGCHFVDEAFGDEDIVRGTDAAPERRRNARRLHPFKPLAS